VAKIRVSTVIDADIGAVWSAVEDISTHTRWMGDAEAIRFTSEARRGIGTTFDCDTKVGPFRLRDAMEITRWDPGMAMGVRHVGLVTGTGEFTLVPAGTGRTEFRWEEELDFPRWMGGTIGDAVGRRVLERVWRANLARLKALVEQRHH
jgi:uncharacterized protein YndB with AHSA1/START domain